MRFRKLREALTADREAQPQLKREVSVKSGGHSLFEFGQFACSRLWSHSCVCVCASKRCTMCLAWCCCSLSLLSCPLLTHIGV